MLVKAGRTTALLLKLMTRAASDRLSQDGILGFRALRGHYWELGAKNKLSPLIVL